MAVMEAAMDDLMRHATLESTALLFGDVTGHAWGPPATSTGWDYEAIEIVERVDDMLDDWFVGADDALVHDELPVESRLGSTLFFGSVTVAVIGGVVATLVQ